MFRRELLIAAALSVASSGAFAQDTVKIGLILPMTGQQASTGKQIDAAVQALHGAERHDGRRQEDRGHPQGRHRRARRHQAAGAGAGRQRQGRRAGRLRPHAARRWPTAPIATQSQDADGRDGGGHLERSPRPRPSSCAPASRCRRSAVPMADWAAKNGIKKVVTLVTDYGPGIDAEKSFNEQFKADGGTDRREPARAAAQPRLRAVPAEGARRQARRAVRLRAVGRGRAVR